MKILSLEDFRCRYSLILILLLLNTFLSYSQTDTVFWFVAPEVTSDHGDRPIYLRLSAYKEPADVIISQPANNDFVPIRISINESSTKTVDLTNFIDLIENKPANQVNAVGIKIKSSALITAYYEVAFYGNPEIFSLKGKNALGKTFYIPSQNSFKNMLGFSSFDIVATENNTIVQITPTNSIVGHEKGIAYEVTLNKGQTYSAQAIDQSADNHLMGSKVVANKPIAVTIKDDSVEFLPCGDLIGDQLVPIDNIGNNYVIVKGSLFGGLSDQVYVLSTKDSNKIFINGSKESVVSLNESETFSFSLNDLTDAVYLVSEHPVYVLHLTGYGCEMGGAVLPSTKYRGSTDIAFCRTTDKPFLLTIVTQDGFQDGFILNGNSYKISSASFKPVMGSQNPKLVYSIIEFDNSELPVGYHFLSNSKGVFKMGLINYFADNGCNYGYFSDYSKQIELTYPNGFERFKTGNTYDITWITKGVEDILIEYTINNGRNWTLITNTVKAKNGVFPWRIPPTPSDSCRVKITEIVNNEISDISDFIFSIYADTIKMDIHSVFTPNGDGINDYFEIRSEGLSDLKVEIYDRWGVKINEIAGIDGKWDGKTRNGSNAPDGVYFYYLTATGLDGLPYERKGSVSLYREGITLYPNPVSIELKVDLMLAVPESVIIGIYSSDGLLIYLNKFDEMDEIIIPVSHLTGGLYNLRVICRDKTLSSKFIKY